MNLNIAKATSKAVEVETKIVAKLPEISAEQLLSIADNNVVMAIVNQFLKDEEDREQKAKAAKEERAAAARLEKKKREKADEEED
jgi:hypothetical protein